MFGQVEDVPVAKPVPQQCRGVHIGGMGRPARGKLDLLRRIALQNQHATRFQRAAYAGGDAVALGGRRKLDEDGHHQIVSRLRPGPVEDIGQFEIQRHAARGRQLAGLFQRHRRHVDRMHVHALRGQPYAVAAFAVGDGQRAHPGLDVRRLAFEKTVGRGAEDVVVRGVPRIPESRTHAAALIWYWRRAVFRAARPGPYREYAGR